MTEATTHRTRIAESHSPVILAVVGAAMLLLSGAAGAADGVVEINQNAAVRGGVTPLDTPGFPVTISAPGSYILTGSLVTQSAGTTAIEINVRGVTLDLNGFAVVGLGDCLILADCTPTGSGNGIDSGEKNGTSRNGKVAGFADDGIHFGNNAEASVIEKIETFLNGRHGVVGAPQGIVRDCHAYDHGGRGIMAGRHSAVLDNVASRNGSTGIWMGTSTTSGGGVVRGNSSYFNGQYGYEIGNGASIMGNSATDNDSFGMRLASFAAYGNNALYDNNSAGNQVQGGRSMGNNVCQGVANDDC